MFTKFSPSTLLRNKSGVALVVLALVIGGISAQASGILNTPTGGYLVCVTPKTNVVTHPATTKCPKGYGKLILGAKGAVGAIGQTGPPGITGIGGSTGVAGANGSTILQGTGTLTNEMGINGDYYFNSALKMIYGPKATGTWPSGVSLAGSNGAPGGSGAPGSNGTNGSNGSDATLTCAQGGTCNVGATGPGGGIVFYVQTATPAAPWRYLEAAPNTWSGSAPDPTIAWCSNTTAVLALLTDGTTPGSTATLAAIGSGARNTKLMLGTCTFGAANMAVSYNGGGKSDWFLPSKNELNELCKYANHGTTGDPTVFCITTPGGLRPEFQGITYYSSFEFDATSAWGQNFNGGGMGNSGKTFAHYVRPVRAF